MKPLCDRILEKLGARPHTARELSRALEAEIAVVHRVLRAMAEEGALEQELVATEPSRWRLRPGVRLAVFPARDAGVGTQLCRAVSTRGRRCSVRALWNGLCVFHGTNGGERAARVEAVPPARAFPDLGGTAEASEPCGAAAPSGTVTGSASTARSLDRHDDVFRRD